MKTIRTMISPTKIALATLLASSLSAVTFAAEATAPFAPVEIAAVSSVVLQLDIKTTCTNKGAQFQISNNGDKWPRTATLRMYTADNKSVVSKRKLRLASGQKVTFMMKKSRMGSHPVGIWIEPSWYKREFKYDATVKCN